MLPFHVNSFFGHDIKLTGVAIPKQDGLHLCIHEGDPPRDLFDAKTKSCVVAWKNIREIKVKQSIFGDSMTIRVHSAISGIPGVKKEITTFDLHDRDRELHDEFQQKVADYQAGKEDENVDAMIDDIRDFLTDL